MDDTQNFYLMFGRLEGKVDTLLSQQGGINKRIDDHDTRITQLETKENNKSASCPPSGGAGYWWPQLSARSPRKSKHGYCDDQSQRNHEEPA